MNRSTFATITVLGSCLLLAVVAHLRPSSARASEEAAHKAPDLKNALAAVGEGARDEKGRARLKSQFLKMRMVDQVTVELLDDPAVRELCREFATASGPKALAAEKKAAAADVEAMARLRSEILDDPESIAIVLDRLALLALEASDPGSLHLLDREKALRQQLNGEQRGAAE